MKRNRDDTFLLYYFEDFQEFEELNPTGLYCLSDSTVQIILSALRFSTWPTRWRLDRNDYGRAIVVEYQDTVKAWGDLAYQEVLKDMSCDFEAAFNTLSEAIVTASNKDAISELAAAVGRLADNQCCDNLQIDVNGGHQGTVTTPNGTDQPIFGSEPPIGANPESFPEEFDEYDDYLNAKCAMANYIADALIRVLRNLSNLTIAQFTAGVIVLILASVGAIACPPAAIPIILTALGLFAGGTGLLFSLANYVEENRAELVCIMYEGENAQTVIALLSDFIDAMIALLNTTGPWAAAIKLLVMTMMNTDTLNKLFDARAAAVYPDADCSDCGECGYQWEFVDEDLPEWEAVSSMPPCFGITSNPPLGVATIVDEKLHLTFGEQSSQRRAAIRVQGIEFLADPGWTMLVRLQRNVFSSLYIDVVFETTENSCLWVTLDNDFGEAGFQDLVFGPDDRIDGETITDIHIYFASGHNTASGTIDIEHIRLICP